MRQLAPRDAGAARSPAGGRRLRRCPGTGTRAFWVGLIVVSLSVVSALATFLILTGLTPIAPRDEVVYVVLFVNLLLVIAMVAVIAVHVVGLWRAWERRLPARACTSASSLLFSVIAALPALLLAVAATTTFSRSLDNWFNQQTMSIVLELAQRGARLPGRAWAGDPHRHRQHGARTSTMRRRRVAGDPRKFRELMIAQAGLRDLPVAYVVDAKGAREGGRRSRTRRSPTSPRPST